MGVLHMPICVVKLRLHRVIPMVQLRSQIFRQMKQKFLTVAALQSRIFVKYDGKMPGKCATRTLRGDALNCFLRFSQVTSCGSRFSYKEFFVLHGEPPRGQRTLFQKTLSADVPASPAKAKELIYKKRILPCNLPPNPGNNNPIPPKGEIVCL